MLRLQSEQLRGQAIRHHLQRPVIVRVRWPITMRVAPNIRRKQASPWSAPLEVRIHHDLLEVVPDKTVAQTRAISDRRQRAKDNDCDSKINRLAQLPGAQFRTR